MNTIDRDPELRTAVEKALETGEPHTHIARKFGLKRWNVDRLAKRIERNGNGEPPKRPPPPKPLPVVLSGETVARLKSGLLPWTHNLIANLYGTTRKDVFDAHRKYLDKLDEENGTAERKRAIALIGEQIVELRSERQKIAADGTAAAHREITNRVSEVEDELERLERAQLVHEDREAAKRFRTPEQRKKELTAGLEDAQAEIYKHRVESERLLYAALASFQKIHALDSVTRAGQHELNSLSTIVRSLAPAAPEKFADFVIEWIQKGERT